MVHNCPLPINARKAYWLTVTCASTYGYMVPYAWSLAYGNNFPLQLYSLASCVATCLQYYNTFCVSQCASGIHIITYMCAHMHEHTHTHTHTHKHLWVRTRTHMGTCTQDSTHMYAHMDHVINSSTPMCIHTVSLNNTTIDHSTHVQLTEFIV